MVVVEPVVRDSLVDVLVQRIRDDVLSSRYPVGSLLPPERELAAGYGVTRTSLKHALMRLAQAGLVHTRQGVGTRVLDFRRHAGPDVLPMLLAYAVTDAGDIDGGWLLEIFAVRREVGALVAARAAECRTISQIVLLRGQLDAVAVAGSADGVQLAECEVHRLLADASGNRVYGLLVNSLLNAYMQVRQLFLAPFLDAEVAAGRLAPVVEAVCAGNPLTAREHAGRYLAETERLMLEQA